ncbi:MAG: LarC family nickel insertion protein [Clostridiales bacterium]|nr:LarC family nickel insertion protein [Clostridiales bacterium]
MKILYFDCTNGVSGDMAYEALKGLLGEKEKDALEGMEMLHSLDSHGEHCHSSYSSIKDLIGSLDISKGAKEKALSIYSVIAEAEASVHDAPVEKVHFHEVGRIEAVRNVVGAAVCADALAAAKVFCSEIHDGIGFVECSHGTIPVPVPAVMAMRRNSGLVFAADESVATEMVTPTGLAVLMGLGAEYSREIPEGCVLRKATAFGKRETGRNGGLTACLVEDCARICP